MSAPSAVPGATLSSASCCRTASISRSPASPTATATEIAMQRSPADPYAAPTSALAALRVSASGITTMWFFAPPRACTRLPCAEAVR